MTHATIAATRTDQTETLQIPIARSKLPSAIGFDTAVSSPEYYLTPAPNADLIGKPLLAGRHLIILNNSGPTEALFPTLPDFHSSSNFILLRTSMNRGSSRKPAGANFR